MTRWSRIKRFLDTSASDDCTVCHKPFAHNSRSYTGFTKNGSIAMVGDCCVDQMREVHAYGIYVSRKSSQSSMDQIKSDPNAKYSTEDVMKGVSALQKYIDATDKQYDQVLRMAGLAGLDESLMPQRTRVPSSEDREWFEQHPNRSHRLRLATSEEMTEYQQKFTLLPDCDPVVIIRQVEPGKRVRYFGNKRSDSPWLTDEASLHGLFDRAMYHYQNQNTALTVDIENENDINVMPLPITKWHDDG